MLELVVISLAVLSGFFDASWFCVVILALSLGALSLIDSDLLLTNHSTSEPSARLASTLVHGFGGAIFVVLAFSAGGQLAWILSN